VSRAICKFTFSILLFLGAVRVQAQNPTNPQDQQNQPPIDTTHTEPRVRAIDSLKHPFRPTGIRFGTDLITLAKSQFQSKFDGWEVNADIDFYRYFLAIDYGYWARHDNVTNGTYDNGGNYYRIGADINFMLKDSENSMFFMGFRYGHSVYDESLTYSYNDPVYQTITKTLENKDQVAHWMELTAGLRVRIVSGLWLGATGRLKFAPGVNGTGELMPYNIPGYGIAEKAPWWGFNYQILWRIPVGKRESINSK
jgi:hypothetical protein